ncbi:MAG: hypothetical protein OXB98_05485 [Bryobacterales bacterium]|nr:hypothetical protein [Bryobacterales bacterium]
MKRNRPGLKQKDEVPLVLLAGLPHPICSRVAESVKTSPSLKARVIHQASPSHGKQLYSKDTVEMLIKAVSHYVWRQLNSHPDPQRPQHLLLAYVPASDEEYLLSEFEFFAFPVRLNRMAGYDASGRQYRHDLDHAKRYVVSSLEKASRQFLTSFKRRLASVSDQEPLFLPPGNFRISKTERMSDIFRTLQQTDSWSNPIDCVRKVKVTSDDLCKSVPTGANKFVLSDFRSLLFPYGRMFHGRPPKLSENSSHEERKHFMRSWFRFGVPLLGGFHHDVQFAGRPLKGVQFECSRKGCLKLSCSHANVYPNDYVRPAQK